MRYGDFCRNRCDGSVFILHYAWSYTTDIRCENQRFPWHFQFIVLRGRRTRGFRGEASCKSPAVQGGRDAEASYSPLKIPFVFRAVKDFLG
ncbi:MAG: hypothetical protein PUD59_06240, partial [bacterium]|nr:hypothetical protein [bacterium]